MTKLWINCAELSADLQASQLALAFKEIDSNIQIKGMGGDYLSKAGQENVVHISEMSVMGITEVIKFLPKIVKIFNRIYQELKIYRPDAIILVDAPDFNFWIARIAKYLKIPVFYFIPPKIWAWRTYRAKFLAKYIQKVYAILPFELEFYKNYQVNIEYFGNPLLENMHIEQYDDIQVNENYIAIMPGSRKKEVSSLLPEYSKAIDIIQNKYPNLEFFIIRAPNISYELLENNWHSKSKMQIIEADKRYAFLKSSKIGLVASGTATLECAILGLACIVAYRVSKLSYLVGRLLIKVKYVSLTNLILNKEAFPELLQDQANANNIAAHLNTYLDNSQALNSVHQDLLKIKKLCFMRDCAQKTAKDILNNL